MGEKKIQGKALPSWSSLSGGAVGGEEMESQAGEVGRGCVMCLIKRGKDFGFSLNGNETSLENCV